MAQTEAATVRQQMVVDAPIEHASTVFTGRFGDVKPLAVRRPSRFGDRLFDGRPGAY
jgi:hypothetical protein